MTTGPRATSGLQEVTASAFDIKRIARSFTDIGAFTLHRVPDARDGAIELIEIRSMRGTDFSADCVAPILGLLSFRVPVPDAVAFAASVVTRGGVTYASTATYNIVPYGLIASFSTRALEGAILEFYQCLN